jgi:uncharacterized protein
MTTEFSPQKLDVTAFAKENGTLEGRLPLADFPRMMVELQAIERPNDQDYFVHWKAHGHAQPVPGGKDKIWLELEVDSAIPQICQRCLNLAALPVDFEHSYRFVATEQQAEEEDEASEEDVLVLSKAFNLLELIEDELLMAMPLIPMHETCPEQLPNEAVDPDFQEGEAKPNPFGALAALKKGA